MEFFSAEMSFFFIGLLCMSRKKRLYRESKNFISRESFTNFTQSRFLRTKTAFARAFLRCPQKIPIFTNQKFSIYRKLTNRPQKLPFYIQKLFICTSLFSLSAKISHFYKPKAFLSYKPFLLPSKATLFCPPLPISTPLNLLFAKNTAVLLISALNPYAVKPERRTDSNHCRRYPTKLQLFAKPVT